MIKHRKGDREHEEVICKCADKRQNRGRNQSKYSEDEKVAEIYESEELELIDSYIEDNPPKDSKEAVWYLGESLKKLAQADVFIGIAENYDWSGCCIERETAERYGIKAYMIPARYVIDDYNALVQKLHPAVRDVLF